MYLPVAGLLNAQRGLVTYRQLSDAGLSPADVRRLRKAGRIVQLRRGVYADSEVWDSLDPFRGQPLLRVRAAGLTIGAGGYAFSHDSSSIAQMMGAPRPTSALVHVSRDKVHGDEVRGGVKHHGAPFREKDLVDVDGLPMLTPARTALDMAREHGRGPGLAACDAALRRGTSRAELEEILGTMWCWPHSRTMQWCVRHADGRAESYLESLCRDLVLELGIGVPVVQLGLTDGYRTVWCDLVVARHVFEPDGAVKYTEGNALGLDPRRVLRDEKTRQDFITGFKLGVSRVTDHDCGAGRRHAIARLTREFEDTCRRFGTAVADLAPYVVPPERRTPQGLLLPPHL